MSSSKSLAVVGLSGLRVAGELQYIPASVKPDGKQVQARCVIPAYINTARDNGDGNSISHTIRLTAWGKLADICAKSLPKGKEFHVTAEPRSYKGQVFYKDGNPVIDTDGTPLQVNKISFNIQQLSFGSDSHDFIAREIAERKRGAQWNVPGTPDHAAWLARIAEVKAYQFTPGSTMFGYAKVLLPRTGTVGTAPPVTNAAGNAGAVHNGLPAGGYTVDASGNVQVAAGQNQYQAPNQYAAAAKPPLF